MHKQVRHDITKLMLGGCNKIYKQGHLTFILTPSKTLVQTPLQAFYLEPRTHYWKRRILLIRTMVELEEIRNLNELASFCASGQVMWVATGNKIEKLRQIAYT